nr:MAG: PilZ domain-containing protein [Pseudomonadota bacterium]
MVTSFSTGPEAENSIAFDRRVAWVRTSLAESKMHDQRKSARAPIDIYLNKIIDDVRHLGRARDISVDGIWVSKILEPRHQHRLVGLELQLPGVFEVINALGEIVREDRRGEEGPEGMAIRFVRISPHHRRLISMYVSRHVGNA